MQDRRRSAATDAVIGAVAGVVATAAMTLAADAMFRRLPEAQRYPLPPRELTERIAALARIREHVGEPGLRAAALASHFGFGAAVGGLCAPLFLGRRLPPVMGGIGCGLAVWAASYLGWIPALGLLRPATEHPARRNALMIAVHVVWGSAAGLTADRLARALGPFSGGALRDAGQGDLPTGPPVRRPMP